MTIRRFAVTILASLLLVSCGDSADGQMRKYIEFYYPSSGDFTYDIGFDWGSYLITTHAKLTAKVHADSEKYRGYVTMRPLVKKPRPDLKPVIYLITPGGAVWTLPPRPAIAKMRTRKEVTVRKTGTVTSTTTTTIRSHSEPVIDHFLRDRNAWTAYGQLMKDGRKYRLKLKPKG